MTGPASGALPSAFDLAVRYHRVTGEQSHYDKLAVSAQDGSPEERDARMAFRKAETEAGVLSDLIVTQPVKSAGDAMAIAIHAHQLAERCEGLAEQGGMLPELRQIMSCFARIAIFTSAEAGIPLALMDSEFGIRLLTRHARCAGESA